MLLIQTRCTKTTIKENVPPNEAIHKLIEDAKIIASHNPDSAINKVDELLDTAIISTKQKCEAFIVKGHALSMKFDLEKSDSVFNEALNWAITINDTLAQVQLYNLLGVNETKRGNFNTSEKHYNTAEKLTYGRTDADKYLVNINNNKGIVYKSTGKIDSAKYYYERAMDYAVRLGDKNAEAMALINIASIFSIYNEYDKQAANLRKAIELYGDNYKLGTLVATMNLSGALRGAQKFDSALVEFRKAESIALEMNMPNHLSQIYYNEGGLYHQMKEYAKSVEYISKSMEIKKSLNDSAGITYNLCAIAGSYAELREYDKAIEAATQAIQLAKQYNNELLWPSYDNLYVALSKKGDWESAAKVLENRIAAKDSLFSKQKFEAIQELQTKYETEQKELQIETLTTQQKYQEKMKILYITIIILLLLLIIFSIVWLRGRQKKQQQQIIELKQRIVRSKYIPHFTGNVLNSINYLIEKDKRLAQRYVSDFGIFNRDSMLNAGKLGRPLCDELEFTEQYLRLEKLRFEDKLEYSISVDPSVHTSVFIPVMLLHTFCENAVKHGFRHKEETGHLKIEVYPESECITLAVEDNGIGRKAAREKHTSGTGEGLSIIEQQINFFNKYNKRKAYLQITDLFDKEGIACGTRFEFYMPNGYMISV